MRAPIGPFDNAVPAPDCLAELVPPVARAVEGWTGDVPADQILYVDTDPAIADTGAFVAHYGQDLLGRASCPPPAGPTSTAPSGATWVPGRCPSRRWTRPWS